MQIKKYTEYIYRGAGVQGGFRKGGPIPSTHPLLRIPPSCWQIKDNFEVQKYTNMH